MNPRPTVVKTFSATLAKDRDGVGDEVTRWLKDHPDVTVSEIRTLQSSDEAYHCLTIVIIGHEGSGYAKPAPTSMPGPGVKRL